SQVLRQARGQQAPGRSRQPVLVQSPVQAQESLAPGRQQQGLAQQPALRPVQEQRQPVQARQQLAQAY
ncbi:hypothetical protein, partial [Pandoraea sputorum]|uniref:hypothetical protein n=1 Tax=Pandoraea sputorum TaxID=93222 RepID=UPI0035582FC9